MKFLNKYIVSVFAGLMFLNSTTNRVQAQDYVVGVRGGSTFESNPGKFQQADVFVAREMPWSWGADDRWNLKPRWEVSAGWLNDDDRNAFVGTTGPVLELHKGKFPVTLEGGISLSALSRYNFPDRDVGGWFEFTDHLGVNWHINQQFTVGWRYQHMSNAGIYKHNPGLNLQMLSASYSF